MSIFFIFYHVIAQINILCYNKNKEQLQPKGTSRSFYIYIDGERKEIDVTSDIYKKYEKGENIEVNIHQGVLGMTYYTVN